MEYETGKKTATSWGKIHYAKGGVHIVPTKAKVVKMEVFSIGYALLAMQCALLYVVTPELRAVVIDICKKKDIIYAFLL